jgi:hypothetical protein
VAWLTAVNNRQRLRVVRDVGVGRYTGAKLCPCLGSGRAVQIELDQPDSSVRSRRPRNLDPAHRIANTALGG